LDWTRGGVASFRYDRRSDLRHSPGTGRFPRLPDPTYTIGGVRCTDPVYRFADLAHPSTPKNHLDQCGGIGLCHLANLFMGLVYGGFSSAVIIQTNPKSKGRLNPLWLLPQIIALGLLIAGTLYTIFIGGHKPSILLVLRSYKVGCN